MKLFRNSFCFLLMSSISITAIQAQSVNPATGGDATGTGGSVTYTVGQIVYTTNTGTNGTVSPGVQQPYEISVVTAIQNTDGIILECLVYPNPTRGQIKLVIRTKDFENLRFQLYNLSGIRIQDKKIEGEETEILMNSLFPSSYILKVLSGNKELKTFKIIKN
jgi:hypothetical protein